MAESKEDKIERLMREGLNHYGMGAVGEAVRSWREVLKLDPDHAEARDFVATAEEAAHAAVPTIVTRRSFASSGGGAGRWLRLTTPG